jgi:hypothetical protein
MACRLRVAIWWVVLCDIGYATVSSTKSDWLWLLVDVVETMERDSDDMLVE